MKIRDYCWRVTTSSLRRHAWSTLHRRLSIQYCMSSKERTYKARALIKLYTLVHAAIRTLNDDAVEHCEYSKKKELKTFLTNRSIVSESSSTTQRNQYRVDHQNPIPLVTLKISKPDVNRKSRLMSLILMRGFSVRYIMETTYCANVTNFRIFQLIKRKNRCVNQKLHHNCFDRDHWVTVCPLQKRCQYCQGKHNIFFMSARSSLWILRLWATNLLLKELQIRM